MDLLQEQVVNAKSDVVVNAELKMELVQKGSVVPIMKDSAGSLQEHYVTPETHLAYAFTWFSLSLISLGFCYFRFRSPKKLIPKL